MGVFNARLCVHLPREYDVMRDFLFVDAAINTNGISNRELLIEAYQETKSIIASTCFDHHPENLVT